MPTPVRTRESTSTTTIGRARVRMDPIAAPLTAPVRNRYFFGKLLDVRHLEMEQAYFLEHRRRLNRLTVGWGVVCGLEVTVGTDGQAICVAPGFAIDGRGREIVVTEPICVADPAVLTDACGHEAGKAKEPVVTLCLAYHECDSDPSPVLVDDCDLREACVAGAVRERYKLLVHDGKPDELPYGETPLVCRLIDYRMSSLAKGARDTQVGAPAPPAPAGGLAPEIKVGKPEGGGANLLSCDPPDEDCVVLATVTLASDQADAEVDAFTYRRIVLSNDRLLEALLCLAARDRKRPQTSTTIDVRRGDGQEGPPDKVLPEEIGVEVKAADGSPVPQAAVEFEVTSGLGGSFEPAETRTNAQGTARAVWRIGAAGHQTAVARLADGTEATFTATAKD